MNALALIDAGLSRPVQHLADEMVDEAPQEQLDPLAHVPRIIRIHWPLGPDDLLGEVPA
jgi:hypothetical protein